MAKDQKRIAVQTPVLKLELETEVEIKILTPFKLSTQTSNKMEPATIAQVESNGEIYTIVANKALVSTIINAYPDESYIGKTFGITKHEKEKGKKYFKFSVFELK